jgi:hypothetical protein
MIPADVELGRKGYRSSEDGDTIADPISPTISPNQRLVNSDSSNSKGEEHKNWASFLAFLLIFLGWATWEALMSFIKQETGYGDLIHGFCDSALIGCSIPIVQQIGPTYLREKRAVAVASVTSAVGVWDLLDLLVHSFIEPGYSATLFFYASAFVLVVLFVLYYERRHDYDIIGGHLINTS